MANICYVRYSNIWGSTARLVACHDIGTYEIDNDGENPLKKVSVGADNNLLYVFANNHICVFLMASAPFQTTTHLSPFLIDTSNTHIHTEPLTGCSQCEV